MSIFKEARRDFFRKKSRGFAKFLLHWKICCGMIFQHSARHADFPPVPGPQSPGLAGGMKPPEGKTKKLEEQKPWQIPASYP